MIKISVHTREEMIKVFDRRGIPLEITSKVGAYNPYPEDSINDVFDEAMRHFTHGATYVTLHYKNDLVVMPGLKGYIESEKEED